MNKGARQRSVQYPWGATCPVYWPKAYAVLKLQGWNTHFTTEAVQQLARSCPDIELLESGELLLNITHQQRAYNSPVHMLHQLIASLSSLLNSHLKVGLAGDALAAFLAVRQLSAHRLDETPSIAIVPAWDAQRVLQAMPLAALDGLLSGAADYLQQYGLQTVADVQAVPSAYLSNRYGDMGRAIVLLSQGKAVPRHLWDAQPPVEFSTGSIAPHGKLLNHKTLGDMHERLQQQLAKRAYEAGQVVLELHSLNGGVRRHDVTGDLISKSVEEAESNIVLCRLIAREISPQRVQGELFADIGRKYI